MTKQEIQKHIEKLKNGRAATSDAHQIELIDLGLSKYRKMLADLEKKSDPQPAGKTGQLEQPNRVRPELSPSLGIPALNETAEKLAADKANQIDPKTAASIANEANQNYDFALSAAPTVAPKPTATIHFAGQQYPGQYTRGELWSDVRQNFKLVLLSATFRRCLSSRDYSELWSMVLYVKLWQGIHEGLKKLEGGKDYTMEELLIRHWAYGEDLKEAGRVLADFLKQPKPE